MKKEQRTKTKEQRTMSKEQRTMTKEQRTKTKEQRTKTKEQRTMSKEQRIMKKTRKKPVFLSALCFLFSVNYSLFSVNCSLLIVLCSLFIGCDVDPDFMKRIDDEVAWSNATRLTVRVDYPGDWGISNPSGPISNVIDIRQGLRPFEMEFIPDIAYNFMEWRAYATADLTEANLGGDWQQNLLLLDDTYRKDNQLEPINQLFTNINTIGEIIDVKVPVLSPRGGRGLFLIHTTVPVTLIPWCETEPFVTRTEPLSNQQRLWHVTQDVIIHFNSQLDPDMPWTLGDTHGMITIKGRTPGSGGDFDIDLNNHFQTPEYQSRFGSHTVTIIPKKEDPGPPPGNLEIEMTVGPGILNAQRTATMKNTVEKVYWTTSSAGLPQGEIDTWSAVFPENSNSIDIELTAFIVEDDDVDVYLTSADETKRVNVYYKIDGGYLNPLFVNISDDGISAVIKDVNLPNTGNVRQGQTVSEIRKYTIRLELIVSGYTISVREFSIWNIPGMNTNDNIVPLTQENFATELIAGAAGGVDNRVYALTEDIVLTSWIPPAGTFSGKFYGNGYTVTIRSFGDLTGITDIGLFRIAGGTNSFIRDLTVLYEANPATPEHESVTITPTGAFRFGGITGTAEGNAQLLNVRVLGSFSISGSNGTSDTNAIHIGGMAGQMTGTSSINNAYGGLNLTVKHSGTTSFGNVSSTIGGNSLYIGGIAGLIDGVSSLVNVKAVSVVGNIIVGAENELIIVKNNEGIGVVGDVGLFVGGFAGRITGALLDDVDYQKGRLTVWCGGGSLFIGGAIGITYSADTTVTRSFAIQDGFEINKRESGANFYAGGFVGYFAAGRISNCYSENPLNVSATGGFKMVGGFAARLDGNISYCYAKGDVRVSQTNGTIYAGGFVGESNTNAAIQYCYATGNIDAEGTGFGFYVGGFVGAGRTLSDCYSTGNVFVQGQGSGNANGTTNAGGLIGLLPSGTYNIDRCFSTGTVTAHRSADGETNAGGLVGGRVFNTVTIQNSVTLGASVTATGFSATSIHNIGRVYGGVYPISGLTFVNNHAFNGIRLFESATYQDDDPTDITDTRTVRLATNKDGADASVNNFLSANSFWIDTLGFNRDSSKTGLGSITNVWNFAGIEGRGYPLLNDSDGRLMGGQ
ncbi:MAG: hypothetical protein FWD26_04850 [Treponema sp.]|nr:hypothetical protein [Treponema sp.]